MSVLPETLQRFLPLLTNWGGAVLLFLLVYLGYRVTRKAAGALEQRQRISGHMALQA